MKRSVFLFLIVTLSGSSTAPLAARSPGSHQRGNSEAVSVQFDVNPGSTGLTIHLLNGTKHALEAWTLKVSFETSDGRRGVTDATEDTYLALALPPKSGRGPVAAGGTRDVSVDLSVVIVAASVELMAAVFTTGTNSGDPAEIARILGTRERDAAAMTRWIAVLADATQKPDPEKTNALQTALKQTSTATPDYMERSINVQVSELIGQTSPSELQTRLLKLKELLEAQRRLALRHKNK